MIIKRKLFGRIYTKKVADIVKNITPGMKEVPKDIKKQVGELNKSYYSVFNRYSKIHKRNIYKGTNPINGELIQVETRNPEFIKPRPKQPILFSKEEWKRLKVKGKAHSPHHRFIAGLGNERRVAGNLTGTNLTIENMGKLRNKSYVPPTLNNQLSLW